MIEKNLKKGDNLSVALLELEPGNRLTVPYRLYSEASIRTAAVRASVHGGKYHVNAQTYKCTVERVN